MVERNAPNGAGRFAHEAEAGEVSVGGAELLDRIERQGRELGVAQARIAELERALTEAREASKSPPRSRPSAGCAPLPRRRWAG
jgi:hypothetical protein